MSEQDYLQADQEVLSMFSRENRSQNPTVGVIVPLNRVQAIDRDARYRRQVALILKASGRAGLGLVFVGAMGHGLMDPVLSVVMLLGCIGWAVVGYWREHNG